MVSGAGYLVAHVVAAEIEKQLTPEQIEPLGDLHSLASKMLENKPEDIKKLISGLVYMAQKGVLKKRIG